MSTTLYATFRDLDNAERAAGALLDYGVRPEDLSLVRMHDNKVITTPPDAVATHGSVGAVGSSGIDASGHSAAAYGDEPAMAGGRFGADAVGLGDTTGMYGAEAVTKREEEYVAGTSRASDTDYDTLSSGNVMDEEGYSPETAAKSGITPTTPADAGAGAIKGAGIGLGVGAIAALVSIFVPGFGLIAGGGALATALAGFAATTGAGAIAGAITGYLKDQGMDSHVAEEYGQAVSEGGALMSIAVPSGPVDESTARSIFEKYAALNVTDYAGTGSGGYVA